MVKPHWKNVGTTYHFFTLSRRVSFAHPFKIWSSSFNFLRTKHRSQQSWPNNKACAKASAFIWLLWRHERTMGHVRTFPDLKCHLLIGCRTKGFHWQIDHQFKKAALPEYSWTSWNNAIEPVRKVLKETIKTDCHFGKTNYFGIDSISLLTNLIGLHGQSKPRSSRLSLWPLVDDLPRLCERKICAKCSTCF